MALNLANWSKSIFRKPLSELNLKYYIDYFYTIASESKAEEYKYNPDRDLTASEIIKRHGYKSESHIVQTEDGYLLTIHRIPASKSGVKGKQPVYLQHGLLASSTNWINAGKKSLGFILADNGYDVWLGNARGNVYSRGHVWMSVHKPSYWNFSWHEMGIFDVPAVISHICETTGKEGEILYVGHSMGTTMFFVYASLLPQSSKSIKAMVGMAPAAILNNSKSPIRFLTKYVRALQFLATSLGISQYLPSPRVMKMSYHHDWYVSRKVYEKVFMILNRYDKEVFDETLLPIILSHIPAGTSMKTIIHYMQLMADKSGKFAQFDYGKGNIYEYNHFKPPSYYIGSIKVPMYLLYSLQDLLVVPENVKRLRDFMWEDVTLYEVPIPTFTHVDFLWGISAPEVVYQPVLEYLKKYPML